MSSRHLNPYFHWCAGCWKWVCHCIHCVEPLNIKRRDVKDIQIHAETRRKGEKLIESCEYCNPLGAEIPFDNILDRVTGSDPSVTDYILEEAAKCPNCRREILEKTLVEPA